MSHLRWPRVWAETTEKNEFLVLLIYEHEKEIMGKSDTSIGLKFIAKLTETFIVLKK